MSAAPPAPPSGGPARREPAAHQNTAPTRRVLRVGGMAFSNGVLMRSGASWAWARDDGTILHGTAAPILDSRAWLRLPVLRSAVAFIDMAAFSLRLHRLNGRRRTGRLLVWLAVCIVASIALSSVIHALIHDPLAGAVVQQLLGIALALAVLQLGMGTEVWRYHGAEHKAVNAYEKGVDLDDGAAVLACSRIHDRCGSNLVLVVFVLGFLSLPMGDSLLGQALSPFIAVVVIALALELFRLVERSPRSPLSRAVLLGGRTLQRVLTTREPGPGHIALASRALLQVIDSESTPAP